MRVREKEREIEKLDGRREMRSDIAFKFLNTVVDNKSGSRRRNLSKKKMLRLAIPTVNE